MNIPQGFAAFFQGAHLTDAEIELLTQIAQKDELAVVTMQSILLKAVQASIQVQILNSHKRLAKSLNENYMLSEINEKLRTMLESGKKISQHQEPLNAYDLSKMNGEVVYSAQKHCWFLVLPETTEYPRYFVRNKFGRVFPVDEVVPLYRYPPEGEYA